MHEKIWVKKCRSLNNDLNEVKNILAKTHKNYMEKENDILELQRILDEYQIQYGKACDMCIAISSICPKSSQFLDGLILKPGLSKQPYSFDEEIKHLCLWIKDTSQNIKTLEKQSSQSNQQISSQKEELSNLKDTIEKLQNKNQEIESSKKLIEKQKKEFEEKLEISLKKQTTLKKKFEHMYKGCQLLISGAPPSAYRIN